MLDQGKITRVHVLLLSFLTSIKGDFLCVGDDAGVSKTVFALQFCFCRTQFPKGRGHHPQDGCGGKIGPPESSHSAGSQASVKSSGEQVHVKRWLADVSVQLSQGITELGNISGNQPVASHKQ